MLNDPNELTRLEAELLHERGRKLEAEDRRARHRMVAAPVEAMCKSIRLATWQRLYGQPPLEQGVFDPADACPTAKEAAEKMDRLRAAVIDDIRAEKLERDVAKSAELAIKRLERDIAAIHRKKNRQPTSGSKKQPPEGTLL